MIKYNWPSRACYCRETSGVPRVAKEPCFGMIGSASLLQRAKKAVFGSVKTFLRYGLFRSDQNATSRTLYFTGEIRIVLTTFVDTGAC